MFPAGDLPTGCRCTDAEVEVGEVAAGEAEAAGGADADASADVDANPSATGRSADFSAEISFPELGSGRTVDTSTCRLCLSDENGFDLLLSPAAALEALTSGVLVLAALVTAAPTVIVAVGAEGEGDTDR